MPLNIMSHSTRSLLLPTPATTAPHTRTCFTFLRRFHRLWKLSIDREKNCKTSPLVYHDVSCHHPEWTFYPIDVMLSSSEEAILCFIPPHGGDGWAQDEAWHVSGAWSGWSVAEWSVEWWNRGQYGHWPAPRVSALGILTPRSTQWAHVA